MTKPIAVHPAHVRAASLMREALRLLQVDESIPANALATDRMLRMDEVKHLTGLGSSSIYDLMAKGRFPKKVQLIPGSDKGTAWRESEIKAWIESRPVSA